jgi:site-specific DNA-methyltransferase (adenine-specific)
MSIITGDCIEELKKIDTGCSQIIICDPPYNIGKDYGNNKCKMTKKEYISWCSTWITDCLRILKSNGTMFIYGYSETLSELVQVIPENVNKKWLVWHYTNKTCPNYNFWQSSHESILVLWKDTKIFNRDLVRVPYTESYLKSNGRKRTPTIGRFSDGKTETLYKVHPLGALPKDVIKVSSLAGNNSERVNHPTQKPLELCDTLIKSCKQKDGIVVVPFAGSGSECLSAKINNLDYIGIELNPEYVELIKNRLCGVTSIKENDKLLSDSWKMTKSYTEYVYKKTQYDYYLENQSSVEVLQLVNLNSKVFGTVCEKVIIEILGLSERTSSQNDASYTFKEKMFKFEIKVGRFLKMTDDCMWQHIEPDYDYDYLLCCVLTFTGFEVFYMSKKKLKELILTGDIRTQGKQGFIFTKNKCLKHLVKINNILDIFNSI